MVFPFASIVERNPSKARGLRLLASEHLPIAIAALLRCDSMKFSRRWFLSTLAASALSGREWKADIAILGGGTGGCAAALGALRNGMRVVMTEETGWIGGQITSQAVSALDEHPWIESFGATRSYRGFRNLVRQYYRQHFPLTVEARERQPFNPGGGFVSNFACEPRVALEVLESMLARYVSSGQLILLLHTKAEAADVTGDRIRAVRVKNVLTGNRQVLEARYFLDATELGDLLPLTKTEYVTGFESQRITGEPSAPFEAQPENEQAFTVCFAMDYLDGEDHTIEKPEEYSFWRDYLPALRPPWPGKLLSWDMSNPRTLQPRQLRFDPREAERSSGGPLNLWLYRRIASRRNFSDPAFRSDVTLVNWPQNDYWLGRLIDVTPEEWARHVKRAKQLSLSLLYWMQTEAPRPRGGRGWKGLRLRPDICGTEDGLAMYPYVRESRRIQAEFTVTEVHVSTNVRAKALNKPVEEVTAEPFPDSVGVGSYRIDLHPTTGGDNYLDVSSLPFQIPLGALIPKRMENLLPACKNLGVTHITNGCYRLHPVEWNIGEAVGMLAAYCIQGNHRPREVRTKKKLLAEFQQKLHQQGVETAWPRLTPR
ncbi:MAG: FAD-dependent oxidoreductase [Bryobacteraceae bacterium]|nr:FAD-dependent oxidoreductase [Bryobacteraceae bacterium]MDW8377625.1 FAD-dependent oxidoreductase [Bryobacterales bacterium]